MASFCGKSLVFEWLELALAADARDSKIAVLILGDEASLDKLVKEIECSITIGLVVLHHFHLGLEGVVLIQLCLRYHLLLLIYKLLILNLLLSLSSLATGLQHCS